MIYFRSILLVWMLVLCPFWAQSVDIKQLQARVDSFSNKCVRAILDVAYKPILPPPGYAKLKQDIQALEEQLRQDTFEANVGKLLPGQGQEEPEYFLRVPYVTLRCRLCIGASERLLGLLKQNLSLKQFAGLSLEVVLTVDEVLGSSYHHMYIIAPDYFSTGHHLYIDPTVNQFFSPDDELVLPDLFVGSKKELESVFRQYGFENIPSYFDVKTDIRRTYRIR